MKKDYLVPDTQEVWVKLEKNFLDSNLDLTTENIDLYWDD